MIDNALIYTEKQLTGNERIYKFRAKSSMINKSQFAIYSAISEAAVSFLNVFFANRSNKSKDEKYKTK